jgi:outer membrane protein
MDKNGQKKSVQSYKREQELGYAQQALAQQLQQQQGVEMDFSFRSKKFIKDYGKERLFLYLWNWRCSNCAIC